MPHTANPASGRVFLEQDQVRRLRAINLERLRNAAQTTTQPPEVQPEAKPIGNAYGAPTAAEMEQLREHARRQARRGGWLRYRR